MLRGTLLLLFLAAPAFAGGGRFVSGRVLDEAGRPVAGALLLDYKTPEVRTDAEGRFRFVVERSDHAFVCVFHHAFLTSGRKRLPAPSEGNEIVLSRGRAISGRVVFPDGTPIEGAVVRSAREHAGIDWGAKRATTAEDGSFRLTGFEPGEERRLRVLGEARTAAAGEAGVEIVGASHVVRLRMRDEEGAPIDPEEVWAACFEGEEWRAVAATCSPRPGESLVAAVMGDRVLVSPVKEGHEMPVVDVRFDGPARIHDVHVVLRPLTATGVIVLTVRDSLGHAPKRVDVTVRNRAGAWPSGLRNMRLRPDKRGVVTVRDVPPGRYRVTVGPPCGAMGYSLHTRVDVEVRAGVTTRCGADMPRGGKLKLRVDGARRSGRAFEWDVDLVTPSGGGVCGSFRFPRPGETSSPCCPLEPGRYTVRVSHGLDVVAEEQVEIEAGRTASLTIGIDPERIRSR